MGKVYHEDLISYNTFVDRGNLADFDFEMGDFTIDGAWHDLDLSAIVPSGAKTVAFVCRIRSMNVNYLVQFKEKGNVNDYNRAWLWTQVAMINKGGNFNCAVDSDRKIQYKVRAGVWSAIDLTIKGWWF